MRAWAERLAAIGTVQTFDYDYMRAGRKRPDRLPELIAAHRAALAHARAIHDGPVVLAGKSMGGRIGCHLSLVENVQALICFGYPLCGGGHPAKLRDQVLRELKAPILFVQGTRDPLCPLELLAPIRAAMPAVNELHVVDGGDHSLGLLQRDLKARGETQEEVDARSMQAVRHFLERVI